MFVPFWGSRKEIVEYIKFVIYHHTTLEGVVWKTYGFKRRCLVICCRPRGSLNLVVPLEISKLRAQAHVMQWRKLNLPTEMVLPENAFCFSAFSFKMRGFYGSMETLSHEEDFS